MNTERYEPAVKNSKAGRLIAKARKTNDERDAMDGFPHAPHPEQLRTAIEALGAGVKTEDWSCVAEALCIVQDVELEIRLRPARVITAVLTALLDNQPAYVLAAVRDWIEERLSK